jgi:hypothetical protein
LGQVHDFQAERTERASRSVSELQRRLRAVQEIGASMEAFAERLSVCAEFDKQNVEVLAAWHRLEDEAVVKHAAHESAQRLLKRPWRPSQQEEQNAAEAAASDARRELSAARKAKRDAVEEMQPAVQTGWFPHLTQLLYSRDLDYVREFNLPADR